MKIYHRFENWLFQQVDNSGIILFRILFGLLLAAEGFGALLTGWVHEVFIDTQYTFAFIGFQWLADILHGSIMNYYYIVLGSLGLLVSFGFKYKWSMLLFFVLWWAVYLSQKTHYNNHYYLMVILSGIMVLIPANRYMSIDVKLNPQKEKFTCPRWCYFILIALLATVYFYASFHKLYPDWLQAKPMASWFKSKSEYPIIGNLLQEKWMHYAVAYGGILFDGLIVPLLLWKRTRRLAVVISIFFHIFNSIVFQIGVFPYLMIAYLILFFPPEKIRRIFFKKKPTVSLTQPLEVNSNHWQAYLLIAFLVVQLALPLRHYLIEGNVFFTEEGHRMSWRMMLRSKRGFSSLKVIDNKTGNQLAYTLSEHITAKQKRALVTQPDMIYTQVQKIKTHFLNQGFDDISIHWSIRMSLNRGHFYQIIDQETDLAQVKWNYWGHNDWIKSP